MSRSSLPTTLLASLSLIAAAVATGLLALTGSVTHPIAAAGDRVGVEDVEDVEDDATAGDKAPNGLGTTPARFTWPLAGRPSVVRPFHRPPTPYGPGHRGVDLAAEPGQAVLAASEGRVAFAGKVAGRGVVSLDHNGGLRTTYEPVHSSVSVGQRVRTGQVIGAVETGHTGCPERACLHWGVRRGTDEPDYLDPVRLVRPDTGLRLKPWDGIIAAPP